VQIIKQCRS